MKRLWKYLKIIITASILGYFVYYFFNNKSDLLAVLQISPKYLGGIFLLYSLTFFINGIFIKVILKSFNKTLSTGESFHISIVSSLGNYFLPMRGGAAIRSVYLKKKYDFCYAHFVSTLYGNYIIVFLVSSLTGLLSLILIDIKHSISSFPLYLFFGGLFTLMLILSLFKFPLEKIKESKNKPVNRILQIIKNILNGWNIIVDDKGLLISLIGLTLVNLVISNALFYFQFIALNIEVSFLNVILYNCLSGVSLLVSITPGSLGIREGIFSITANILEISNEQIMQLALLDRGAVVIVLVLLFAVVSLTENIKKMCLKEGSNSLKKTK